MKLIDRIFGGRAKEAAAPPPAINLERLDGSLSLLLEVSAGEKPDPEVTRARLADTFRDIGVEPVDPEAFDALAQPLDEGGWARLDLVARSMKLGVTGDALGALVAARGVEGALRQGFIDFAQSSPLLTIDLLRQSSLRLEELARRFIASLGALVEGETPEVSSAALERLDYARLLAEVERAKMSAEERMAYLQKLQEEHDASRPNRGKW